MVKNTCWCRHKEVRKISAHLVIPGDIVTTCACPGMPFSHFLLDFVITSGPCNCDIVPALLPHIHGAWLNTKVDEYTRSRPWFELDSWMGENLLLIARTGDSK